MVKADKSRATKTGHFYLSLTVKRAVTISWATRFLWKRGGVTVWIRAA